MGQQVSCCERDKVPTARTPHRANSLTKVREEFIPLPAQTTEFSGLNDLESRSKRSTNSHSLFDDEEEVTEPRASIELRLAYSGKSSPNPSHVQQPSLTSVLSQHLAVDDNHSLSLPVRRGLRTPSPQPVVQTAPRSAELNLGTEGNPFVVQRRSMALGQGVIDVTSQRKSMMFGSAGPTNAMEVVAQRHNLGRKPTLQAPILSSTVPLSSDIASRRLDTGAGIGGDPLVPVTVVPVAPVTVPAIDLRSITGATLVQSSALAVRKDKVAPVLEESSSDDDLSIEESDVDVITDSEGEEERRKAQKAAEQARRKSRRQSGKKPVGKKT